VKSLILQDWLGKDNKLGYDIWENKYQNDGETFEEWLSRVSAGDETLKNMIVNKEFIFGGRILANRGLNNIEGRKITYSNCYVIKKPEDNLESIFDTAKKLARTFSYGGGCGVDISNLRPKGAQVKNAARATTGAVSFMDLYNLTTDIIGQNGRRGALMLSMDINHPDVSEFIKVKSDLNKIKKANISVRVNDKFMEAVEDNKTYKTQFIVRDTGETIENEVNPKELFKELAYQNWNYAEPGVLFWDNISNWNLLSEDHEFEYDGVNPCAEEPLPAGGSCLLGSLILPSFVKNGVFDFGKLREAVKNAVKALNDVLDEGLPLHPLNEQQESVKDWRQIGLGILGVGDMLIHLGIRYGSQESIEFCNEVAKTIIDTAIFESSMLAKEKGAYPKFKKDKVLSSPFLKENASEETIKAVGEYGLRNSQLLTIAPTGSIGTMLQMSTGIEPNFAFSYTRKTESLHGEDVYYKVYVPIAKNYMEKHGIESEDELPDFFVTAQNLDPIERVKMQGIWQKRIDASISSTVNLVNETTVEEVEKVYMEAWKNGLKGLTVYRSGCAREGILTLDDAPEEQIELNRGELKPIADDTVYYPKALRIGCGKLKLMIGYSDEEKRIQDIYAIRSGQGGCEKNIQSTAIYMSGMLRLGGNIFMLEKAIEGISACNSFAMSRGRGENVSKGTTCASSILYALKDFEVDKGLNDYVKAERFKLVEEARQQNKVICPECGEELEISGGCYSCRSCGYSKCD